MRTKRTDASATAMDVVNSDVPLTIEAIKISFEGKAQIAAFINATSSMGIPTSTASPAKPKIALARNKEGKVNKTRAPCRYQYVFDVLTAEFILLTYGKLR